MKYKIILLILAVIFLVLFLNLVLTKILIIKKIQCETQYGSCGEDLKAIYQGSEGKNYAEVKKFLRDKLTSQVIIQSYSTAYKIPSTLNIYLLIHKPSFAVKNIKTQEIFLIESQGIVLSQVSKSILPTLDTQEYSFLVNDKIPEKVMNALKTFSLLSSMYRFDTTDLSSESFKVKVEGGPLVIFPLEGEPEVLAGAARLIVSRLNSDKSDFKINKAIGDIIVDLRFRNPVLR